MNRTEQAIEFRRAFSCPMIASGSAKVPNDLLPDLKMQLGLIKEEGNEFKEALDIWVAASRKQADEQSLYALKENVLKELSDLVFVCEQMAAFLGVNLEAAMHRVFMSNMSKLDENGKPVYRKDGKVLKGSNYQPPDLSDLV